MDQEIVNQLKSILNWEGNKNIVKPFKENDDVDNGKANGSKPKVDTPIGKKFPEKAKEKEAKSKENEAADCTGDVCIPCLMPRPNKVRKIEQNENTEIEKKKRKMIHPPKAMLRVRFFGIKSNLSRPVYGPFSSKLVYKTWFLESWGCHRRI